MQKEGLHIHIPASLKKSKMSTSTTISVDDLSTLYDRVVNQQGKSSSWRWQLTADDNSDWYPCVNCGDLMLDQRSNPNYGLNCNTCGNGHESLMKVDPVVEAQVRNQVIEQLSEVENKKKDGYLWGYCYWATQNLYSQSSSSTSWVMLYYERGANIRNRTTSLGCSSIYS